MEETPNTQEETNISETESSSVSENQNGFNPLLIGGGLVLLIIVGVVGIMLASNKTASTPENMKTTTPTAQPGTAMTQETASGSASEGTVKTFTVAAENFSFTLPEIKVKMGDTVKITLENKEGMHDWVIDEFNARTKLLKAGESDTIEFVANKVGSFEYYCSVGSHRQMGMKGNLIVE
jgi:plastocyanin